MDEATILNAAGELVELRTGRHPDTVMQEAAMVSKALARYAHEHSLYKQIGPSKHLQIEGWQMCGAMFRVTTRIVETRFIDLGNGVRGYEATAEAIYVPTGAVIGRAESMCMSDEENWGLRPKYEWKDGVKTEVAKLPTPLFQLRSMAETRASANVLESLFRWVAKIGGFTGTPAEDMTGSDGQAGSGKSSGPQRKSQQSTNSEGGNGAAADVISEAQAKRMYAIAKNDAGYSDDQYKEFLSRHGYEKSKDVKKSHYEQMIAEMQNKGDAAD